MRIFIAEDTRVFKIEPTDTRNIYTLDVHGQWKRHAISHYKTTNGVVDFSVLNEKDQVVETFTVYPKGKGLSVLFSPTGERVNLVDTQEVADVPVFARLFSTDPAVRATFWDQDQDEAGFDAMETACLKKMAELKKVHRNRAAVPEPTAMAFAASNVDVTKLISYAEEVSKRLNHKYFWNGRQKAGNINRAIENLRKNRAQGTEDLSELVQALTSHRHRRKSTVQSTSEKELIQKFPEVQLKR